jgi:F0F1-type ATP synthase assembly protein I
MRELAPYLTLGTQLTMTVLFLGGIGWLIDDSYGTSPWWLVVGLILGCVIGFYQFLRSLQQMLKRDKERRTVGKEPSGR